MKGLQIKEFIKYVGENSKKHGFREREINKSRPYKHNKEF